MFIRNSGFLRAPDSAGGGGQADKNKEQEVTEDTKETKVETESHGGAKPAYMANYNGQLVPLDESQLAKLVYRGIQGVAKDIEEEEAQNERAAAESKIDPVKDGVPDKVAKRIEALEAALYNQHVERDRAAKSHEIHRKLVSEIDKVDGVKEDPELGNIIFKMAVASMVSDKLSPDAAVKAASGVVKGILKKANVEFVKDKTKLRAMVGEAGGGSSPSGKKQEFSRSDLWNGKLEASTEEKLRAISDF